MFQVASPTNNYNDNNSSQQGKDDEDDFSGTMKINNRDNSLSASNSSFNTISGNYNTPLPVKRGRGRPRKYPLPEGFSPSPAGLSSYSSGITGGPAGGGGGGSLISRLPMPSVKYLDYLPYSREKLTIPDGDVISPEDPESFLKLQKAMEIVNALPESYDIDASNSKYESSLNSNRLGLHVFQLKSRDPPPNPLKSSSSSSGKRRRREIPADEQEIAPLTHEYYVIALDLARHIGFKDSYTFFKKCGHEFERDSASEVERCWLADIGALNANLRLRNLAIINMKYVFPVYGDQLRACNANSSTPNPVLLSVLEKEGLAGSLFPSSSFTSNSNNHLGVDENNQLAWDDDNQMIVLDPFDDDPDSDVFFSLPIAGENDLAPDSVYAARFRKRYFALRHASARNKGKTIAEMIPDTFAYNQGLSLARTLRSKEFVDYHTGWPLAPFRHLNSASHVLGEQAIKDFKFLSGDSSDINQVNDLLLQDNYVRYDDTLPLSHYPLALTSTQHQDRFPMATPIWSSWYSALQKAAKLEAQTIKVPPQVLDTRNIRPIAQSQMPILNPNHFQVNMASVVSALSPHQPFIPRGFSSSNVNVNGSSNGINNSNNNGNNFVPNQHLIARDQCKRCKERVYAAKNNPLRMMKLPCIDHLTGKALTISDIPVRAFVRCHDCKVYYHRDCADLAAALINNDSNRIFPDWQCPDCKKCTICKVKRAPSPNTLLTKQKQQQDQQQKISDSDFDEEDEPIILCDECDSGFHLDCLQPPLNEVPDERWVCALCISCVVCGQKCDNPKSSCTEEFHHVYATKSNDTERIYLQTICQNCRKPFDKGEFCMVCHFPYPGEDDETEASEMVCCDYCDRWVHAYCDKYAKKIYDKVEIETEKIEKISKKSSLTSPSAASSSFCCPICRTERDVLESEDEDDFKHQQGNNRKRGRPRKYPRPTKDETEDQDRETLQSISTKPKIKVDRSIGEYIVVGGGGSGSNKKGKKGFSSFKLVLQ